MASAKDESKQPRRKDMIGPEVLDGDPASAHVGLLPRGDGGTLLRSCKHWLSRTQSSARSAHGKVLRAAIRHLYISPGHNFFGHHGRKAGRSPITEVAEIECVAGRGIRGDRFFDYRENYKGQITFFAIEVYASLCEVLSVSDRPPSVFRRNVITEGTDLNALIGEEFVIRGIRFRGTEECKPCYWMDQAFAPGTEEFLRGRGGLRAVILSDGRLSAGAEPYE